MRRLHVARSSHKRENSDKIDKFPQYPASDWPATPGNDPLCFDQMFMQWSDALAAGTDPNVTAPGLAYMLAGGSDPSNTDPFAMEPAPGEEWIATPPHIMLLFPGKLDTTLFTTDPQSGGPYVMWAGTPYEHIMMPVYVEEEMQETDEQMP